MPLSMEVGLSPGDIVLDEDPARPPQQGGGAPPQLSAHVYCGQTAGCIKMVLGVEVDLSPGDFVLDMGTHRPGSPLPKKGRSFLVPLQFSYFRPISIVAKWLDTSRCHLIWR